MSHSPTIAFVNDLFICMYVYLFIYCVCVCVCPQSLMETESALPESSGNYFFLIANHTHTHTHTHTHSLTHSLLFYVIYICVCMCVCVCVCPDSRDTSLSSCRPSQIQVCTIVHCPAKINLIYLFCVCGFPLSI